MGLKAIGCSLAVMDVYRNPLQAYGRGRPCRSKLARPESLTEQGLSRGKRLRGAKN